jgi:hypothetical protein
LKNSHLATISHFIPSLWGILFSRTIGVWQIASTILLNIFFLSALLSFF